MFYKTLLIALIGWLLFDSSYAFGQVEKDIEGSGFNETSSFAKELDELRILEIVTTLSDEHYWPHSPLAHMSGIPTQNMIDAFEKAHPAIEKRRLLIEELDQLIRLNHSANFLLRLLNLESTKGLDLNLVVTRIISENSSYTDDSIFQFLALQDDHANHASGLNGNWYTSLCKTAISAFVERGDIPSNIKNFMLENNHYSFRHLGKVSSALDYQIIEDDISLLLELSSQKNSHPMNNILERLAMDSYLGDFNRIA